MNSHKKALTLSILSVLLLTLTACSNVSQDENSGLVSEVPNNHTQALIQNLNALEKTVQSQDEKNKVIELIDNGSVYYLASNGKRYIFPTIEIYKSWFGTYKPERKMSLEEMQNIPLGGNVTMRPGSLINTPSDTNIYLVQQNGIISVVEVKVLKQILGDYSSKVLEIPNYYFTNYEYGDKITDVNDFPFTDITLTIDQDKGLDDKKN